MQHYTFAVKAFVEVVEAVGMEEYEFAVHETQTNQVIENVRNMKSELGILFLSKFNEAVLQKLFKENDVIFEELFTCDTYVYLWKGHPLAQRDVISMKELQEYPCLVFEQGKNNSFYFAEEMKSAYEYKKMIHADDRATMLNLMVGLNGYTLCSGIICEELNGNDYAAVPLAESEKMRIGYIRHKGTKVSPIGELYVDILKKSGEYEPVRWKTYIDKVDAYQGEIVSKSEVLKQFKLKVKRSQDQLVLDEWEECDLLLREIFAAFEK